ncbi:poly(U)-specific 3'-to-5' RNA exonuclease [Onygenales sp. PD_40]|nr:poly(U)-specific 3'-to-5' RNA exonuclease [Onygenales sp. PD_40]KAK2793683.1 poly(U)-specific 3'-to-5' RNA exonuclease [Onygenales sp. PD_12]
MALVAYSDSDSDESGKSGSSPPSNPSRPPKRQRIERGDGDSNAARSILPRLPTEFRDLYTTNSRISVQDDPSLHDGRKRVAPHVVGNWPTHIYLEWYPTTAELATLERVISQSEDKLHNAFKIHTLLFSDLGVQLPLHISLSRPVVLVTEDRHPFKDLLDDAVRESEIRPIQRFGVKIGGLDWVSNFEKTRWFLVLRVNKPVNNELNRLLGISNTSLAAFGQPPLYQNASPSEREGKKRHFRDQEKGPNSASLGDYSDCFHMSIAWSLTEPSNEDKQRVSSIDLGKLKEIEVRFNCVKVKIGNGLHNLELPAGVVTEKGFSGL